ncbi:hypothetical protein V1477_015527 [Vespula maculifrons]|uniref:Uncharacterized protein n=1 Tax=Vespula maculifrons TaxID=7453 RepID=A0ABD2BG29_VESMC
MGVLRLSDRRVSQEVNPIRYICEKEKEEKKMRKVQNERVDTTFPKEVTQQNFKQLTPASAIATAAAAAAVITVTAAITGLTQQEIDSKE